MGKLISLVSLLWLVVGPAYAGEKEEATRLVNDAASAVVKDKNAAVTEISNKTGRYVKGEIYVFAYDLTGTMVAHPINPKLVGKNLIDVPDADGKMFRKDIITAVTSTGTASVRYKYKNPQTGAVEEKTTFCKKAVDLAVCAGYYE